MPVLKQQTVHQETKKYMWADYQNLHLKDEYEELKAWLHICKEETDPVVDCAACFESKPTAIRDAAAESLEAQYFERTSDAKQGPSGSPPRSSTIGFPIRAREKQYVTNHKLLTTQGISEKRQSWIVKILNKPFGESWLFVF